MRSVFTIDTASQRSASQSIDWGADGITVINPTLSSIIIGQGPSVPASVAIPNSIFVPPLSVMSRPVSGSVFAAGFIAPALTSSQDWPTTAQIALTQGEALPSYGSFPITDIEIGSGSSVDVNVVNAAIPITSSATLDVSVQNPSIPITSSGPLDVTVQNASIPITASGNLDVQVQNATIDTQAGQLSGTDIVTGSPFSQPAGTSGIIGPFDLANWGGIALGIMAVSTSESGYRQVEIDTSQDNATWFSVQRFNLPALGVATLTIPRMGRYLRVNFPNAGNLTVTVFARYIRTEVLSDTLIVPFAPSIASGFQTLTSADFWTSIVSVTQPTTEILYLHLTAPSNGDNTIRAGIGLIGNTAPTYVLDSHEGTGDLEIELGPFLPGEGISMQNLTAVFMFTNVQCNLTYEVWYR